MLSTSWFLSCTHLGTFQSPSKSVYGIITIQSPSIYEVATTIESCILSDPCMPGPTITQVGEPSNAVPHPLIPDPESDPDPEAKTLDLAASPSLTQPSSLPIPSVGHSLRSDGLRRWNPDPKHRPSPERAAGGPSHATLAATRSYAATASSHAATAPAPRTVIMCAPTPTGRLLPPSRTVGKGTRARRGGRGDGALGLTRPRRQYRLAVSRTLPRCRPRPQITRMSRFRYASSGCRVKSGIRPCSPAFSSTRCCRLRCLAREQLPSRLHRRLDLLVRTLS